LRQFRSGGLFVPFIMLSIVPASSLVARFMSFDSLLDV
jgi:hypothetical protein